MPKAGWRNRITRTEEVAPDQLLANPANFRRHGKDQQEALAEVLDTVGWVQDVIVNEQTGHVVDGHLRVELALRRQEPAVPVKYISLSPAEEAKVLATFDPISALARTDSQALADLTTDMAFESAALNQMLSDLVESGWQPHDGEWDASDGFDPDDVPAGYDRDEEDDEAGEGDPSGSDGSLLNLVDVTLGEPKHETSAGQVWEIGRHVLVIADVITGWRQWKHRAGRGGAVLPVSGAVHRAHREGRGVEARDGPAEPLHRGPYPRPLCRGEGRGRCPPPLGSPPLAGASIAPTSIAISWPGLSTRLSWRDPATSIS